MKIVDKLAEDVREYVIELIEENNLSYVDEELSRIIFNNYVYALVKTKIEQAIMAFIVIIFGLYVIFNDAVLLPKWVKWLTGYIMTFRVMPTSIWVIGEHALDMFAKKTIPEIFEENKSLWKFKDKK